MAEDWVALDIVTLDESEPDPERERIYRAVLDAVTMILRTHWPDVDAETVELIRLNGWLSLESVLRVAVDVALHEAGEE